MVQGEPPPTLEKPHEFKREKKDQKREREPISNPKKKLLETLRPSKESSEKILSRINETTVKVFGEHPQPEVKNILEVASGIFLWHNMLYDTGDSLPLGLLFRQNPANPQGINWWDDIALDENIITLQDYDFVMNFFRAQGIYDDVISIQKEHRRTHRDEISRSIEELLHQSRVSDYFDSFSIETEKESNEVRIEPGTILWQREKSSLDAAFVETHGPNSRSDPKKLATYQRQVLGPLRHKTTSNTDDETQESATQKGRFRKHVQTFYIAKSPLASTLAQQNAVIVQDGEFLFPQDDDKGNRTYVKDEGRSWNNDDVTWNRFLWNELDRSGPYLGL